jgi:hypothetical protein
MLEIAAELGVTESRVSQLRAEALILLRDGLNAHLDPDTRPSPGPRAAWPSAGPPITPPSPPARTSGPGSTRPPRSLLDRAAESGSPAPASA